MLLLHNHIFQKHRAAAVQFRQFFTRRHRDDAQQLTLVDVFFTGERTRMFCALWDGVQSISIRVEGTIGQRLAICPPFFHLLCNFPLSSRLFLFSAFHAFVVVNSILHIKQYSREQIYCCAYWMTMIFLSLFKIPSHYLHWFPNLVHSHYLCLHYRARSTCMPVWRGMLVTDCHVHQTTDNGWGNGTAE